MEIQLLAIAANSGDVAVTDFGQKSNHNFKAALFGVFTPASTAIKKAYECGAQTSLLKPPTLSRSETLMDFSPPIGSSRILLRTASEGPLLAFPLGPHRPCQ